MTKQERIRDTVDLPYKHHGKCLFNYRETAEILGVGPNRVSRILNENGMLVNVTTDGKSKKVGIRNIAELIEQDLQSPFE